MMVWTGGVKGREGESLLATACKVQSIVFFVSYRAEIKGQPRRRTHGCSLECESDVGLVGARCSSDDNVDLERAEHNADTLRDRRRAGGKVCRDGLSKERDNGNQHQTGCKGSSV